MRALVVEKYDPYDSHALKDMPDPVAGPGQVVIETRAMSVNFPDVLMVEGLYQNKPRTPFVAGFDCAGVVHSVGADVIHLSPGDRVFVYAPDGAFAERALVPADCVHALPEGKSFEEGAAFGLAYLTAQVSMVENAGCRAGETVLVTGASGGVGLAMIQYGAALGMRMIGGVTSEAKAELVRANGAAATVDLATPDLRNSLREQIHALTGGRGVDVVMDMVGGDIFDAALRAIAYGGRIAIVGFAGGRIPEIKANYLLMKKITAIGSPLGAYRAGGAKECARAMAAVMDCWKTGGLHPHISEVLPFADWKTAFGRFKRREVTGKIVLVP